MKKWLANIFSWMESPDSRDLERYLAKSANASDLERRMREWEQKHQGIQLPPLSVHSGERRQSIGQQSKIG